MSILGIIGLSVACVLLGMGLMYVLTIVAFMGMWR